MEDLYNLDNMRKKPKRKNSKAKGSAFERKVAKLLNEHFETTDFQRTPGSGAFATTHKSGLVLMAQDRRDIIVLIKQDSHICNQLKLNNKRIIYILKDYALTAFKDLLSIDRSLFFN